jgi:glucose/arabinose dehydrogenase
MMWAVRRFGWSLIVLASLFCLTAIPVVAATVPVDQTIDGFASGAKVDKDVRMADGSFNFQPVASSGLTAFTFSTSDANVISLPTLRSGSSIIGTFKKPGLATITVSQAGNATYATATIQYAVTVLGSEPAITAAHTGDLAITRISGRFLSDPTAISKATQMVFGPDGRLYVVIDGGTVKSFQYLPSGPLADPRTAADIASEAPGGTALGIAFHGGNMYVTQQTKYVYPGPAVGCIWRLGDSNGNGIYGETGETRIKIVSGITNVSHHIDQLQVLGDRLFVSIGSRTSDGISDSNKSSAGSPVTVDGETAWTANVCSIDDLNLVPDSENAAGFTDAEVVAGAPFTSLDPGKLRVWASGLRNPFGIALDPLGRLWATNNYKNPAPNDKYDADMTDDRHDQLFLLPQYADAGYPNAKWRDNTIAMSAGFFLPERAVRSVTPDNVIYNPDLPGELKGLGPHCSADGFAWYGASRFPAAYRNKLFITRLVPKATPVNDGVTPAPGKPAFINYADVVMVDPDTGSVQVIAKGFGTPIDAIEDQDGNLLVCDYTFFGFPPTIVPGIHRISAIAPVDSPQPATVSLTPIPARVLVTDAPLAVTGNSSVYRPVTITSSAPDVVLVVDGVLTFLRRGTATITAQQAADRWYQGAEETASLTVAGLDQTITFDDILAKQVGDPSFALAAVASSGLPVTYTSSAPGVATIVGNQVTLVGPGTAIITATQAGDDRYEPTDASQILTVTMANRAPTVANVIPAQTATVGTAYIYAIPTDTFADADGDPLTLSVTGLPSWATFTVGTRTITGTPTVAAAAVTVVVTANDGRGGTESTNLSLTALAANRAPTVANVIPAQTAKVGTAFSYVIPTTTFADADSDPLTLSVTGLPSWATFTVGTRTIAGTPTVAAAAVTLVVTANDGRSGTVSTNLSLTVTITPVDLSSLPKPGNNNNSGCGAGGLGGLGMALLAGVTLMKRDRRTRR